MKKILMYASVLCTLILLANARADAITSGMIRLPDGLTKIESEAFMGCNTMTSLRIPASVSVIGRAAFMDCSHLSYVFMPETVSYIAEDAFSEVAQDVVFEVFPDTYAEKWVIDHDFSCIYASEINHTSRDYLYTFCDGQSVAIVRYSGSETECLRVPAEIDGYDVVRIGAGAFRDCAAKEIILPDTLQEIGFEAFYYAEATVIHIPESVVSIESEAFMCCDVEEVFLPAGVSAIGTNPFRGCRNLEKISVAEENAIYGVSNNALVSKADMKLISYPYALVGDTLTIPDGICIIGNTAFGYEGPCFTKLVIPDSVTEIQSSAFCFSQVEEVEIGGGVHTMGYGIFSYCDNLRNVTIKDGAACIGSGAFNHCEALETVVVPNSVQSIADDAFEYAYNVSFVADPDSYAAQYANAHGIMLED